jgi:hypothetical protein
MTKHAEEFVVRLLTKKMSKRSVMIYDLRGKVIDQENHREKGLIPKLEGHRSLHKK